jgi:hypothetical protein
MKNVELKNDFVTRLREAVKKYKEKNQKNNEKIFRISGRLLYIGAF